MNYNFLTVNGPRRVLRFFIVNGLGRAW